MELKTALIVDDSRTSAAILGKMLARQQLTVARVASGEEALAYLVAETPDVIFMDHMMPGMDGFQAVKAIRQQPELRDIPVVMYTSKEGEIYRGQARALGAAAVLQKPAAELDVIGLVERLRSAPPRSAAVAEVGPATPVSGAGSEAPALPSWLSTGAGVRSGRLAAPVLKPLKLHRALIVDDSRTSAAVLAKMLARHEIGCDKVGSGEECLSYLASTNPDIIFMDHMMPGMDGFEAIVAIKQQTKLRAIPIVMYTSQSGDQYIGQARALGAIGVLKKPAGAEDLAQILERLRRDDEHRRAEGGRVGQTPPGGSGSVAPDVCPPPPRAAPDSGAGIARAAGPAAGSPVARQALRMRAPRWPVAASAALALVVGFALGQLPRSGGVSTAGLVEALEKLGNQQALVDYGAVPFDDRRSEQLSAIVEVLALNGVSAKIELRSHVGEFCRVYGGSGARLPTGDTPIEGCDLIGYEPREAERLAAAQSPQFRDFLARLEDLAPGVTVDIVPLGIVEPQWPYPPDDAIAMAGDWNAIAARNNRVNLRISPLPGGAPGPRVN